MAQVNKIIEKMTPAARTMLERAAGTHQGAVVMAETSLDRAVLAELRELGLVGPLDGLTMRGSIVASVLRRLLEDELLG